MSLTTKKWNRNQFNKKMNVFDVASNVLFVYCYTHFSFLCSFHQEDDPSKVEELRKSMKLEAER